MSLSLPEALRASQKELTDLLSGVFTRDPFANRYTLHPRRLAEVAAEVGEEFLAFVETGDEEGPTRRGRALAGEGLGEGPLSLIPSILHTYISRALAGAVVEMRAKASEHSDNFIRFLMSGYIRELVDRTLEDQERTRRALLAAMEAQGRKPRAAG